MLGPYRIGRLLGRGGMGEVYEALDTVKERTIALKLLPLHFANDSDFRERFERESKTASKLSDPHVIPIHDWGEHDGVLFIDMRMVDGKDLRGILKDGPIAPGRAVSILSQIAGALDAAHRSGLVHRDIKPDNILVNNDDFAYLVDFGIAHGETDRHLTQVGTALGTLAYMAPERLNDVPAGPSSDIYALTCVLFESVTGSAPYPSKTDAGIMTAHLTQPPPQTGSPLDPVIARGLAKDPAQRFPTAKELMRAASVAIATTPTRPVHQPGPGPGPAPSGPSRMPSGPTYPPGGQGSRPSRPGVSGPGVSGPAAAGAAAWGAQPGGAYSGPTQIRPTPSGPSGFGGAPPSGPTTIGSGPHSAPGGGSYTPPPPSGPNPSYLYSGGGGTPPSGPQAKKRPVALLVVAVVAVLALIGAGVFFAVRAAGGSDDTKTASSTPPTPNVETVACTYTTHTPVGGVPLDPPAAQQPKSGTVNATFAIAAQGDIKVTMDRTKAPCNVGAVTTMIQNGVYDHNTCHESGKIYLLCGSPNGEDNTNPGWTSPDEQPVGLTPDGTNDSGENVFVYPRGTMLIYPSEDIKPNGGSTMLVFLTDNARLPLRFTILGKVDDASMPVLDGIVKGGFIPAKPNATYGKPNISAIIQTATVTSG